MNGEAMAVADTIARINAAWRENRVDDMVPCMHEDVVFLQPGGQTRVQGRELCVQSYRDFIASATMHEYNEHEPAVDVIGANAVATCHFDCVYDFRGETHREGGIDLYVLTRDAHDWRVIFRTQIPA
jgi:ketosteroid isomerase-like protein